MQLGAATGLQIILSYVCVGYLSWLVCLGLSGFAFSWDSVRAVTVLVVYFSSQSTCQFSVQILLLERVDRCPARILTVLLVVQGIDVCL